MDDLHATFLPRFVESSRTRLARAIADALRHVHDATQKTAIDLHTIAGDAALLELPEISRVATACEHAAKQARGTRSDEALDALASALSSLDAAIAALSSGVESP